MTDAIRISFDLHDTLVCDASVPSENTLRPWHRLSYGEPLRKGTQALLRTLHRQHCRLWIDTTSRRSPHYIAGWFRAIDTPIQGIVNLNRHEQVVGLRGPSKFPPAFGIGLHIDDSAAVGMEGLAHGFRVLVVVPHDLAWAERVLQTVAELRATASTMGNLAPVTQ